MSQRRRQRPIGDTLGRHDRARIILIEKGRTHLWKPLLHAIAAGSMDPGGHELNYLAQAHWHHVRYRFGEMIGLDRTKKSCGSPPRTTTKDGRSRRRGRSVTTRWSLTSAASRMTSVRRVSLNTPCRSRDLV
jgi:hypothetical protein